MLYVYRTERSTDQVVKPVNMEALTSWVRNVPTLIRGDMHKLAPMLDRLGYDPAAFPPNYGNPDKFVMENTHDVKQNAALWRRRSDDVYKQAKPPAGWKAFSRRDSAVNSTRLPVRNEETLARQVYKYADDDDEKGDDDFVINQA